MAWNSNAALFTLIAFSGGGWWWLYRQRKGLKRLVQQKNKELQQVYGNLEQSQAIHQEELQQVTIALEQAKIAKQNFLAKISSEFKNPLHTILGYAQLLQRYPQLAQESPENLEQIRQNGEHLLALINDILEMMQLESDQPELRESNFNIRRFLKSLEDTLQPKAIAKGLHLVFFIPPDIPSSITTDEAKLRQILLNILDNAIEYTQTGGITLRAGISDRTWMLDETEEDRSSPTSHALFFEIEDTGIGIAPERLEYIFEPLLAHEQESQGIGLGLAVSQKLVKLLGGKISIASTVDQGTIVKLKLTVKGSEMGHWDSLLQASGRIIGLAPNQGEYRLLIVDDRRENRYLLVKFLEPLGFKVEEAANGEEAISFWSRWRPHLIFMDTRMPVMDGYQAIAQIQRLQAMGIVPNADRQEPFKTVIIGLSAGTVEESQVDILAAGCDDILQKPFEVETILEKIAQHLQVRYLYEIEEKGDSILDDEDDISTIPLSEFPMPKSSDPDAASLTQRKERSGARNSKNLLPYHSPGVGSQPPIQPNSLEIMSRDWIEELYDCSSAGDGQRIYQLLEQIPPGHDALVSNLKCLVDQFNFRQLKELTQFLLSRP
jgi:two-component system sensor histidine kinase/response regulator